MRLGFAFPCTGCDEVHGGVTVQGLGAEEVDIGRKNWVNWPEAFQVVEEDGDLSLLPNFFPFLLILLSSYRTTQNSTEFIGNCLITSGQNFQMGNTLSYRTITGNL